MVLPPGGWYEVLSTQLTKTTSLLEIRFFSEKHGRQKQTNKQINTRESLDKLSSISLAGVATLNQLKPTTFYMGY